MALLQRVGGMGRQLWSWFKRAGRAIRPGTHAWRGAALLTLVYGVALALWFFSTLVTPTFWVYPLALLAGVLVLAPLTADLALHLLHWFSLIPRVYRWALLTALALIVVIAGQTADPGFGLMLAGLAAAGLIGGSLGGLLVTRWRGLTWAHRALGVAGLLVGVGLLGALTWWVAMPGTAAPARATTANQAAGFAPANVENPTTPGHFAVKTLSYGSGTDRNRPEYGAQATLITQPVDGSPFVSGWDGIGGWLRDQYWGFGPKNLPLNALVWYPEGAGPFPLVLAVHGNHYGPDFSDPGYAYLCELLASRGSICASVDENFLNGSLTDLVAGLREENDARGWLLLEHLRQWRAWNAQPDNPFTGKVDLERVALIGHSRGGEAVAVAAAFNRLPYYPDNANVRFDYNFGIRSVIALAPIDGQYNPARTNTPLRDVNYLVLQGAYDGDVNSFSGWHQYDRVTFSGDPWFKAAVYIDRANHGQFNTTWGADDLAKISGVLLNRAALMPAADQQQIAKTYISAFVETTLRDNAAYRPLFDSPQYGQAWLPDYTYITHSEDGSYRPLADFGEDIDLTTASVPGGRIKTNGLTSWREQTLGLKWAANRTHAAYVGWRQEEAQPAPSYAITLPAGSVTATTGSKLVLDLADAAEDPLRFAPRQRLQPGPATATVTPTPTPATAAAARPQPLDLTVVVVDREGDAAQLPLGQKGGLQLQLKSDVRKALPWENKSEGEPVLQRFTFGLDEFAAANPAFDAERLAMVKLVFDRSAAGVVVVGGVGLTE